MRRRTAIGVDDDLASRKSGISFRPAGHETSGRVDVQLQIRGDGIVVQHRQYDVLFDGSANVVNRDGFCMLG
jgi:hypothetical protein